ncbi:unannotated protein [freshwater metagenome]|uniref:Unannotated protein n=1 Tax=freshwater metagenome TaxID=449393 RepID=A0A6J6Y6Z2_9ZZZZ
MRWSTKPGKPWRPLVNTPLLRWAISVRSAPDENDWPVPVITTTAIPLSVLAAMSASVAASYKASLKALRASGRSSVSTRTRP